MDVWESGRRESGQRAEAAPASSSGECLQAAGCGQAQQSGASEAAALLLCLACQPACRPPPPLDSSYIQHPHNEAFAVRFWLTRPQHSTGHLRPPPSWWCVRPLRFSVYSPLSPLLVAAAAAAAISSLSRRSPLNLSPFPSVRANCYGVPVRAVHHSPIPPTPPNRYPTSIHS